MSSTIAVREKSDADASQRFAGAILDTIEVLPDGGIHLHQFKKPRGVSAPQPRRSTPQWHEAAMSKIRKIFGKIDEDAEQQKPAFITAVVPAHNEERDIAKTLASLVLQSRPVDRIVVVVNGSTDKTAEIVRMFVDNFPDMVTCVENPTYTGRGGQQREVRSKVAALNYAWQIYVTAKPMQQDTEEYILGLDADVILATDVVEQLEKTLDDDADDQKIGGVRATYGFVTPEKASMRIRSLVAGQQLDFASSELKDQLRHDNRVTILGGQATLFRRSALETVSQSNKGKGPWNTDSLVEDAYLTRQLEAYGYHGTVNQRAHVTVGAMFTPHAWWSQRRKWQNGHIIDVASEKHFALDRVRWGQQFSLGFNWLLRVLFVMLLVVSVAAHAYVFNWLWLVPLGLASLQGTLTASRMTNRSGWLILRAATYVLPEVYVWKTLAVWLASLKKAFLAFVNTGRIDQSDWIRQAKAESSAKVGSWAMWLTIVCSALIPTGVAMAIGFAFPTAVDPMLRYGWIMLAVMSIISSAFMTIKIIRIVKNYRHLAL